MILANAQEHTISVSVGTGSYTLSNRGNHARLVSLRIYPTTSTTEYSFKLTDKFSKIIHHEEGLTGPQHINDESQIPGYSYGSITLTILNSTVDEDFDVVFVHMEHI